MIINSGGGNLADMLTKLSILRTEWLKTSKNYFVIVNCCLLLGRMKGKNQEIYLFLEEEILAF